MGDVYFDGDPATDSARRHMERVLKGESGRRKWPWVAMALGGGGLWALWRAASEDARAKNTGEDDTRPTRPRSPL